MENWQESNGCAKRNTVGEKIKIVSLDNHWVLNFKIHLLNLFIECPVRMSICNKWDTHAHTVAQSWWWSEPANWWCKLCTVITVKASGLASTARTLNELSSPKVKPPPSIWTCHCQLLHVGSCMAFFASLLVFLIFPEVALEKLVVNSIWIENARKQCRVLPHGKVWSEGMFGGYTGTPNGHPGSKANGKRLQ